MESLLSADRFAEMGRTLGETAAHPEALSELMRVRQSPIQQRYENAQKMATVENLASKNIQLDSDFRITTRSFEDPRLFRANTGSDERASPKVYFEDDHGFFEYEDTVITVVEDEESCEVRSSVPESVIRDEIADGVAHIGRFVSEAAFKAVIKELYETPVELREVFVAEKLLNPQHLAARGIDVPKDMKIQRSHFDDNRPTLFCVTKYLTLAYPWHKVTITFDNPV